MTNPDDEKFQSFISIWNGLSEEARSRFVDEYAEELVYFDLHHRLMPGPSFGTRQWREA
jgi:hypothetical protein